MIDTDRLNAEFCSKKKVCYYCTIMHSFYARQQNASRVLAIAEVSVCSSGCPSHCGIVSE